jgi:hypothetical protein
MAKQEDNKRTQVKGLSWGPKKEGENTGNISNREPKEQKSTDKKERATFYIHESYLTTLARAVYWDREESQGAIIEKALDAYWKDKPAYEPTPKEK